MGVKRGEKRWGKVDSGLTAKHIGIPKHKRPIDDPYGAGEHSGKRAKPDAVSAAANTRARAAKEKAAERPPLHHSPCAWRPLVLRPTHRCTQCTHLQCIHRRTSL
jgi:hypothetical protein